MNTKAILSFIVCAGMSAGVAVYTAQAQDPRVNSSLSSQDQTFLKKAAMGDMAEIQLGMLAQQNASQNVVKQFGERMVTDHTRALDQVKKDAAEKGITLPTALGKKDQAEYNRLSKESGRDFDRSYISLMLKDHKADIADFEQESNSGQDQSVKTLASNQLPTLREHLQLAENAAKQLGIAGYGGVQ